MATKLPPTASVVEIQATINYYARNRLYRHVLLIAQTALQRRAGDPVLQFWRAFGTMMDGNITDAIRDLENLRGKREVQLATLMALLHAHKQSRVSDTESVAELSTTISLMVDDKSIPDKSLFLAANFLWLTSEFNQARELCQRVLELNESFPGALALRGWIDLTCGRETLARKACDFFDRGLSNVGVDTSRGDLECHLGKAKWHQNKGQKQDLSVAIDQLNKIIVGWAWFYPALSEKIRILLSIGEWEQASETLTRAQTIEPRNIDALHLHCLILLARESQISQAQQKIGELIGAIEGLEPRNSMLWYEVSRSLARICGRTKEIMGLTLGMVDRAAKIDPHSAEIQTELGYQHTLTGQYPQAAECYRKATKLDESNMAALHGMIKVLILQGSLVDAEQQLEFLNEIQASIGRSAELSYLWALLAWQKDQNLEESIKWLNETVELQLPPDGVHDILTPEYIVRINPDFLIEIAKQYMQHCGYDPIEASEPAPPMVAAAIRVLEVTRRLVPGIMDAQVLLARTHFIVRNFDMAQSILTSCVAMDPTKPEPHILMAYVHIEMGAYQPAHQSLEQALSHNFEIRSNPQFHLIKAKIFEKTGKMDQSLQCLETAMQLPVMKRKGGNNRIEDREMQHYKAGIYVQLAMVNAKLSKHTEAAKMIQEATQEFQGTPEAMRILMANAEIALIKGDVHSALRLLKTVPESHPFATSAKIQIANIHLKYRRNTKLYIQCYQQLLRNNQNAQNFCLLGEAYMRIQEPEKAIEQFEAARVQAHNDPELAGKIGQALVSTHKFDDAIAYYRQAIQEQPERGSLRIQLANLFMKLKRYEEAAEVIKIALQPDADSEQLQALMNSSKLLLLSAQVYNRAHKVPEAIEALQRARQYQNSVLAKMRGEQPEIVRVQRKIAADICAQLGEYHEQQHAVDKAFGFYHEALKHDEAHQRSILSLAKLHLDKAELQQAQEHCQSLLKSNTSHEEASMMLADIMFRMNEFEAAIHHFQQLLEHKPNHYVALSRLVSLLRRSGRIMDAPRFLKQAERSSARAATEPGLHYCKGLFYQYTYDLHQALMEYNQARTDTEWGERAIMNMIEIYLSPDNDNIFEDISDRGPSTNLDSIAAAEKLRKELVDNNSSKIAVYEGYEMMLTKTRPNIEKATNHFIEILKANQDYVPALLGLSYATLMQKAQPKALTYLKRINKLPYNSDEGEEFERAWLLFANTKFEAAKYDDTLRLCQLCLSKNLSCAKAYEVKGMVAEKQQNFQDAAEAYEAAWKHTNQNSPVVGYKLAFNYLKAKRYVDAIDVCHKVLTKDPNYPKIRKEILEKARAMIRA